MTACDFCIELNRATQSIGREIWENEGFVLLPTVGCFAQGYCLLLPRGHFRSFAALPSEELLEGYSIAEAFRNELANVFGMHFVLAEHGAGRGGDRGASCCDHAHFHLVPCPDVAALTSTYRSQGGIPDTPESISELNYLDGESYLYLSPRPDRHYVWQNANSFPRQFIRRVLSDLHGIPEYFDWRRYPFWENMKTTKSRLIARTPFASIRMESY